MLRLANVQRELRGIVIALLMVGATIIVSAMLTHFLDIRRGSVIYLIPVLLAGWHLGPAAGIGFVIYWTMQTPAGHQADAAHTGKHPVTFPTSGEGFGPGERVWWNRYDAKGERTPRARPNARRSRARTGDARGVADDVDDRQ